VPSQSNPQFALPAAGERLRCGACGNLTREVVPALWAAAGTEPAER
jgi:hypothetical protein